MAIHTPLPKHTTRQVETVFFKPLRQQAPLSFFRDNRRGTPLALQRARFCGYPITQAGYFWTDSREQ